MRAFADLVIELDNTTKTNVKVRALSEYFTSQSDEDKVWTIALLSSKRPKRAISTTLLRNWAAERSQLPDWLFEESYHVVGDLAETIALILPEPTNKNHKSLSEVMLELVELKDQDELNKKDYLFKMWDSLDKNECFVFNKLLTGGFRIGISRKLMTRALSQATGIEENNLALRLMGNWEPVKSTYQNLVLKEDRSEDLAHPYPFYLAYALDVDFNELGKCQDWIAERKWDGIRGQIVYRKGNLAVWSRGEELVTDKYPEYAVLNDINRKDFVIDGEILAYKDGRPLPFQELQKRIGRKTIGKKLLSDVPVIFMAYDILEIDNQDIRSHSQEERRKILESLITDLNHEVFKISPLLELPSWEKLAIEREKSREFMSEGIMLKKKSASYKSGRKKGDWWKWKIDPLQIDAVLIYAMRGHGRRANLYTDYTFAVWDKGVLVPFAKAYSGLSDAEFKEVDSFVKKNTLERFGPVRSVEPELVFEIAFEGIAQSKRHKSGIALRFPRMSRWRKDKKANEANTLEDLKAFLNP